jgi:hypothetical protein
MRWQAYVHREGDWYIIDIPGAGVTQAWDGVDVYDTACDLILLTSGAQPRHLDIIWEDRLGRQEDQ